jgi:hypothetical protein
MRKWQVAFGLFVCGVLSWISLMWSRKPCLILVVRGPHCDEILFYSEMVRLEGPVLVRVEVIDGAEEIVFVLNDGGVERLLGRLMLPDTRVYRRLPPSVVRSVFLLTNWQPSEVALLAMRQSVHDAAFHSLMQAPKSVSTSFVEHELPSGVFFLDDPRVVAECFLFDVASARHDLVPARNLVVDNVCAKGIEHHGGDWFALLEAIEDHFEIQTSKISTLEQLKSALLQHRNTFSSAMLTPSGANKLELVFGVPATQFPFLNCSLESFVFVQELYSAATESFGRWTYENFVAIMHAVFSHDRPEVVRHVPRIFRTLNRSRNGEITFDELCGWIAKKLSTRTARHPEQQLLATVMSLRLPYALFADKRHLWPKLECALRSLSDDEYHL